MNIIKHWSKMYDLSLLKIPKEKMEIKITETGPAFVGFTPCTASAEVKDNGNFIASVELSNFEKCLKELYPNFRYQGVVEIGRMHNSSNIYYIKTQGITEQVEPKEKDEQTIYVEKLVQELRDKFHRVLLESGPVNETNFLTAIVHSKDLKKILAVNPKELKYFAFQKYRIDNIFIIVSDDIPEGKIKLACTY